ncbi:MAG: hypothetical protein RIE77_03315 [Phycisphaerales bacterium]|jgi:hypothetical protein
MIGARVSLAIALACIAAFASACTYIGQPTARERSRIERGEAAFVLYRYTKGHDHEPSRFGLAFDGPADSFTSRGSRPIPRALSKQLAKQGWFYQVLKPGRHVSLVEHKSVFDAATQLDAPRIEFAVPEGVGVVYVGSVHRGTRSDELSLSDEWAEAAAIIEAERAQGRALARVQGPIVHSSMRRYDRPTPMQDRPGPGATVSAFLGDAPAPVGGAVRGMAAGASPGVQLMGASLEAGQGDPLLTTFVAAPGLVVGAFVAGVGSVIGAIVGSDDAERERIRKLEAAFGEAQVGLMLAERVAESLQGRVVTDGAADVEAWITRMDFPRIKQDRCIEIAFRVRARDDLDAVCFDRLYVSRHPDATRSRFAAMHELPLDREPTLRPRTEWWSEDGPDLIVEEVEAAIEALGERVRIDLGP